MALQPKMMRQCTDEKTFIKLNGIDSFRRTFGRKETEQLLCDPIFAEANTYYEKVHGVGISQADIDAFIAIWGDRYDEWFVRKTFTPVFPFEKNFRDYKGTPVPQGKGPFEGIKYGDTILPEEIYIRRHGILNYMIRYKTKQNLEELMSIPRFAEHQQAYIHELEYEGLLI